jgi:hypothetical protein
MREEREMMHEQAEQIREQAVEIAEEYMPQLEAIGAELSVKAEEWEKELLKITEQAMTLRDESSKCRTKLGKKGHFMKSFDIETMDDEVKKAMAARFLLWDGSDMFGESPEFSSAPTSINNLGGMLGELDLRSFPNPAVENSKVFFSLPESSDVSLKVFDMNGNVVKVLIDKQMPSGEHEVNFNTVGLQSGAYYYRLVTGSKSQTKSFMIHK